MSVQCSNKLTIDSKNTKYSRIITKMVLSYFVARYLVQPEDISPDFNVTQWNVANPDFYVPPHPLLYLVYFQPYTFALALASNLFLPYTASHILQIFILAGTIVLQPIRGIQVLPNFFWKAMYLVSFYALKGFEWRTLMSLLAQAHATLTNFNVYYWILNYLYFGVFATWPILRPDLFQKNEELYCSFWSCWKFEKTNLYFILVRNIWSAKNN